MHRRADYSAELILVCNSLEAACDEPLRRRLGDAERVREYDPPRALAAWESVLGIGEGSGLSKGLGCQRGT